MITPQEIKKKSERKYVSVLQSLAKGEPFSKLIIRADKSYTNSSLSQFAKEIELIYSQSKEKKGFGYTLDFQQIKAKRLGRQDLPRLIYFETKRDFFKFLGKEEEVRLFKENIDLITRAFPELTEWIVASPQKIIDYQDEWEDLLKICQYFKSNPVPKLYIRELPVPVHTKFVENHKGILFELLNRIVPYDSINHAFTKIREFEKRFNLKYAETQVRFKILDAEISQKYFSGLEDISTPVSQFASLQFPIKRVFVVENKTTLYTALTLPKMKQTLVLFGKGFGVSDLQNIEWLNEVELFYWGDIDAQGFEILSQFRGYFHHTKSILMDVVTFDKFFDNEVGTISKLCSSMNLTEEEQKLYERVKTNQWRLEQEKIPHVYVQQIFSKWFFT